MRNDAKTPKSRRTIALSQRCPDVLEKHGELKNLWRANTVRDGHNDDVVFVSATGMRLMFAFWAVVKKAGLNPTAWTARGQAVNVVTQGM